MSLRMTHESKMLAAECEALMKQSMAAGRYDLTTQLNKLNSLIYTCKTSNSEIKKCLNDIGMQLYQGTANK